MTWHCNALLALLTGQTWPRCFQSLECCEYCCHPATIRACTTPSVSTSANQNPKYFGKVWQQNKWNFANFLQPPLITCQEMRRPEWKNPRWFQAESQTSQRDGVSALSRFYFSQSILVTEQCTHHPVISSLLSGKLLYKFTFHFEYFLSPWLIWCLTLIRDKLGHRRLLTRAG